MLKTSSHVQKKAGRTFSGEGLARDLVDYLNSDYRRQPAFEREQQAIIALLEAHSQLRELVKREVPRAEIRAQQVAVEKLCRRYSRFFPMLWVEEKPPHKDRVRWWSPKQGVATGKPASLIDFDTYDHISAISDITAITAVGHLDKIHRCNCGAWFFARFSHMRFCSQECQQRTYKDSPEWREYRRKKAQEYYKLHKEGRVKGR